MSSGSDESLLLETESVLSATSLPTLGSAERWSRSSVSFSSHVSSEMALHMASSSAGGMSARAAAFCAASFLSPFLSPLTRSSTRTTLAMSIVFIVVVSCLTMILAPLGVRSFVCTTSSFM